MFPARKECQVKARSTTSALRTIVTFEAMPVQSTNKLKFLGIRG